MKYVHIDELQRWGFECPECGAWNELDDDPSNEDTVSCEDCGAEVGVESVG